MSENENKPDAAVESTDWVCTEEIVGRMVSAQIGDGSQYRSNPEGSYPICKPALRTSTCERCGGDVREYKGPCPSIPKSKRWGDTWEGHTTKLRDRMAAEQTEDQ